MKKNLLSLVMLIGVSAPVLGVDQETTHSVGQLLDTSGLTRSERLEVLPHLLKNSAEHNNFPWKDAPNLTSFFGKFNEKYPSTPFGGQFLQSIQEWERKKTALKQQEAQVKQFKKDSLLADRLSQISIEKELIELQTKHIHLNGQRQELEITLTAFWENYQLLLLKKKKAGSIKEKESYQQDLLEQVRSFEKATQKNIFDSP